MFWFRLGKRCWVSGYGVWARIRERVPVTVDSGAIDSVIPKGIAKGVETRATDASRKGLKYRAANGTAIVNEGEKSLKGAHA